MRALKITIAILLILIICATCVSGGSKILKRMDFNEANLLDVLRAITSKAGMNLVVSADNQGVSSKKITVSLRNIEAVDAIDFILRANGYSFEREGSTIIASSLPQDILSSAYRCGYKAIELKHLSAERVMSILNKISTNVSSAVGHRSNLVLLKGKSFDVEMVRNLILSLDRPLPQVLIESKVVEVSEAGIEELGLRWGREEGKFKFAIDKDTGRTGLSEDILSVVEMLLSEGKANVIASPRISTLDDHEASINIGSRIPYVVPASTNSSGTQWTVQYLDAGVSLKILPKIGEGGYITALIKPEVSSVSEWRITSAGEFPVITTRNAEATVRVKDGETIAVGGLINEAERENISRIPFLSDIPILGFFFSRKVKERAKTEIVFLITPYIVK